MNTQNLQILRTSCLNICKSFIRPILIMWMWFMTNLPMLLFLKKNESVKCKAALALKNPLLKSYARSLDWNIFIKMLGEKIVHTLQSFFFKSPVILYLEFTIVCEKLTSKFSSTTYLINLLYHRSEYFKNSFIPNGLNEWILTITFLHHVTYFIITYNKL